MMMKKKQQDMGSSEEEVEEEGVIPFKSDTHEQRREREEGDGEAKLSIVPLQ